MNMNREFPINLNENTDSKPSLSRATDDLNLLAMAGVGTAALIIGGRYIKPVQTALRVARSVFGEAAAETTAISGRTTSEVGKAGLAVELADASTGTASKLPGLAKYLEAKSPDELRNIVFSRFLERTASDRYALQGSYSLELRGSTARKAGDLDFIAVDHSLLKGTRTATSEAVLSDLKSLVGQDLHDGLSFEVPKLMFKPSYLAYPAMRQAEIVAKAEGTELMRFPIDVRIQPRTILPTSTYKLPAPADGFPGASVNMLEREEIFARKLFSYQNSLVVTRGPKDVLDLAYMTKQGVESDKVVAALQAFHDRGFAVQAISEQAPISMRLLRGTGNMKGQSLEDLQANHGIVSNYFNSKIMPRLNQGVDGVPTDIPSRLAREFWRRTAYFVW